MIALSGFGQNAYFTYNKAYGQLAYENYNGAITLFTQAITEKPDLADAYANRGLAYHKLGKYDEAIADYLKDNSLKKDRSSYNLACAYSIKGNINEAFKYLELCQKSEYKQLTSTLENDTDLTNLHSDPRWATLLATDFLTPYDKLMVEVNDKFGSEDYEGSLQACIKAIELDKNDKRGYISKGYILTILGKYNESITEYNKLIQLDANDFEGYAGKANVYYSQSNYADALVQYEIAVAKNPYYMPLYQTGMCKYGSSRSADGVSDLKKYCEIYPFDDMTQYTCGRLLYDMERESEARSYAEKAIELNQTVPEYYMLRAYINHVQKRWDAAISDYSQVITLNGTDLGEAYFKRGLCRAEKFALSNNQSDRAGFCSDIKSANELGVADAAQYIGLCN